MAIRIFVFILLSVSLVSLFLKVEQSSAVKSTQERELLTFHDSTLYVLTQEHIESMVQSKKALRYKSKDVMYEAKLISKSKDKSYDLDVLQADVILKTKDNWTFLNNVSFTRDGFLSLYTQELDYNTQTRIARNKIPFNGTYNGNTIKGKNLYFDFNKSYFKASNTHFEVNITN